MGSLRVLAVNAGSSSLKTALREEPDHEPRLRIQIERLGTPDAVLTVDGERRSVDGPDGAAGISAVAELLTERGLGPDVVVHRVVHGGPDHHLPTRVDDSLVADLDDARHFAPLHQPITLGVLAAARAAWPQAIHVACFDTGFHADLPEAARRLPVSETLRLQGIRRYGFHGLSVQSVLAAQPALADVVVAHLGSGCSVTAVGSDRLPRHTSMSFSPASGMISATRSGDLDPEVLLYLIDVHGHSTADLREELNHRAGLAGIAEGHHDLRDLVDSSSDRDQLAVDMFVSSAAMAIAAAATTLDSWRYLVFTGGVGEHQPDLRRRICERLRLSDDTEVMVVPADEERVMDLQARALVNGA